MNTSLTNVELVKRKVGTFFFLLNKGVPRTKQFFSKLKLMGGLVRERIGISQKRETKQRERKSNAKCANTGQG